MKLNSESFQNEKNVDKNDSLAEKFLEEEQAYDEYIENQMKDEIENAALEESDKNQIGNKLYIMFKKIIKSKNSKAYIVFTGYLCTIFRMIYDIFRYTRGVVTLKYNAVSTNIFYYILAIVIPFGLWLWSTCLEQFNFRFIKIATLIVCLLNLALELLNITYLILCVFIVPLCLHIPVSTDVSSQMIISLARSTVIIVPCLMFVVTFRSFLSDMLYRPMMQDILHYKADRNIDTRKNKAYAYDYGVVRNLNTGKRYSVKEDMRKQHMMIEGATGAGKTSMAFLPGIAEDLDQRIKNLNAQKRAVVSQLENKNIVLIKSIKDEEFNAKWLRAVNPVGKKKLNNIFSAMPLCGLTIIAPNSSFGDDVYELAVNRGIKNINRIDPLLDAYGKHKPGYIGFNPFYINPDYTGLELKLAIINRSRIFSDVLQALYESGGSSDVYFSSLNRQFTSSICKMIIKTQPMLHASNPAKYPNAQATPADFENIMNDFSLAQPYYETLSLYIKEHPEEKKDYENTLKLIGRDLLGAGAKTMLDQSRGLVILINELLANPLIRDVLCAEESVDLDKALAESQITLLNYELSLGDRDSRGFGLFFLLTMQSAVFRRPKSNRPIHFLYIDEFPVLLHPSLEKAFSLYRQYNVCMNVALQALSQFDKTNETKYMKNVLLSNASTQILFGRAGLEEMETYEKLGGKVDRVVEQDTVNQSTLTDENTSLTYSTRSSVQKENFIDGRDIRNRDFGEATMLTVDKGNPVDMFAVKLDFLTEKQTRGLQTIKVDWSKYYNPESADGTDIYEAEKLPLHKSVVVTNNLVKNSGYSGNVLYSQSYTVKGNGNTSGIENTDYFYKPKISITSGFENYHNDLSISADYLAPDVPDENDDSSVVKNIENSQSAQEDAILANVNELLENIGKINAG